MTFDLRTLNSNLTCILVSSTYTSKIFKIRPTFLKLLCRNQFEFNELWPLTFWPADSDSNLTCILVSSTYTSKIFKIRPNIFEVIVRETNLNIWAVTFDLWPADSEFELDLYFSVIYLHIKNIQNPSNIFEVIAWKPIWIYELWPLTFDLRTPNSNLTCILVSSTYTSKIFKIRPTFLKLLRGNQFEYIMSCDLWPADSKFELDLYFSVIYLHIKNIQNPSNIFEVIARKPIWI